MTIPRSYFEQTLLETRNRTLAFYKAYVRYDLGAFFFVLVLAFSSCWSEFYISTFVTAAEVTKPFSVILEMNHEQYNAYYSVFAAGACLSLIVSVALPALILGLLWVLSRAAAMRRFSHLKSEMPPERFAIKEH